MPTLHLIAHNPTLRLIGLAMVLIGTVNASLFPYQSLIAIHYIGLTDSSYALVLICASALAVMASVSAGIITDQRANRRQIALLTAALTAIGPGLMLLAPSPAALILCHAVLLPLSASLYGQLLALTRLACTDYPEQRDAILATLRAGLSLTFVVVLTLWSFVFATGTDVMAIYWTATLAGAALFGLILRQWPRDGQTLWPDAPSGLSLLQSLREIAHRPVLIRLILLGAISSGAALYMVLISLVFASTPGRSTSDVALFVGIVAGCEVPFMLALPLIANRLPRTTLIALGAAFYAAYLALMPLVAPYGAIWVLPVLAGIGGAAILTLPITYLQDLMAHRPGTGSSLIALQKVTADSFCATAFALGTWAGGYTLAATFGALIMLAGAATLLLADRIR
ncbi:MAG: MFS transporter [Paracoccaceae bacterium]